MKVLEPCQEHVTNREVLDWLQSSSLATSVSEQAGTCTENMNTQKNPLNLKQLAIKLEKYLRDNTPAGTQNISSIQALFHQLEKFSLTVGELEMIANWRPSSLLQLMCIVHDCERRFTEEETVEMLQIIDTTLEPLPRRLEEEVEDEQSTPTSL
eukprot:jgi/Galph1/574/GphlegSOOS_G5427.1